MYFFEIGKNNNNYHMPNTQSPNVNRLEETRLIFTSIVIMVDIALLPPDFGSLEFLALPPKPPSGLMAHKQSFRINIKTINNLFALTTASYQNSN